MGEFIHKPVMMAEVLAALKPLPGGIYADGTLGGAGHSAAVLAASAPSGRLLACDRTRIHRIGTEADTQRVQHHVLFAKRKFNRRRELVENVGVVNRHLLLAPKLRFKSKEIQSCCRSLDLCSRRPPPLSIEEKCASCTMHRLGELVDAARAWTANSQAAFVRTYCAINRSVSTPIRNATRAVVLLVRRHRSYARSGLQFASCPDNLLRINRRAALAHDWSAGPDRSARHHAAPAGQKQQRARDGEII